MSKPIPVSQATAMVKTYNSYMQTLGVDMKTQTQSVSFNLTDLLEWLNKMTPIADEIRIFMGDYPNGSAEAGRTTVLLWPYKDGQPARSTDKTLATETDPELPGDGGEEDDEGGTPPPPPPPPPGGGDPVDPYNDGQTHP